MFTRQQVDSIEVGTLIAWSLDGKQFGAATPVVEIYAKAEDVAGKLFVCGYRQNGPTSTISFSIKEGDRLDGTLYRIE